jgi:hypothetical protein
MLSAGFEPLFNAWGMAAALAATALRALRSLLQGRLLSSEDGKMDSLSLLTHMAPYTAVATLPLILLLERDVAEVVFDTSKSGALCRHRSKFGCAFWWSEGSV